MADDRAAKGLWVLLVAMGHAVWAWHKLPQFQDWLYQFHVIAFLLLPMMRDEPRLGPAKLADRAVRYLVPMWPILLVTVPLAPYFQASAPWPLRLGHLGMGLLTGHPMWWKSVSGFEYLWFLPTLLGLTLLRQGLLRLPRQLRWLLGAAGLLSMGSLAPMAMYVPLGLAVVAVIVPLGWLTRWLSAQLHSVGRDWRWLGLPVAAMASAVLLHNHVKIYPGGAAWPPLLQRPGLAACAAAVAIGMFLAVLWAVPWLQRLPGLVSLGEVSLPFYLLHSLAIQAVLLAASRAMPGWQTAYPASVGVASLVVAVATCGPIARLSLRPQIQRWWLPRGVADWPPSAWLVRHLRGGGATN